MSPPQRSVCDCDKSISYRIVTVLRGLGFSRRGEVRARIGAVQAKQRPPDVS